MKCTRCNIEMVEAQNYTLRPVRTFEGVANSREEVALVSFEKQGALFKREHSIILDLHARVCPNCGLVEQYISHEDIEEITAEHNDVRTRYPSA